MYMYLHVHIANFAIPQIPCPFYCPQYKGMLPEASHNETQDHLYGSMSPHTNIHTVKMNI